MGRLVTETFADVEPVSAELAPSLGSRFFTKRTAAYEDATMEWVDGNLGSKLPR